MAPCFEEGFLNQVILVGLVPHHGFDTPPNRHHVAIHQDRKAFTLTRQSLFNQSAVLERCKWRHSDLPRSCTRRATNYGLCWAQAKSFPRRTSVIKFAAKPLRI